MALEKEVLFLKERDTQCRLKYKQFKLEMKLMKLKVTTTARTQQESLDKLLLSAENQHDYGYSEYYNEDGTALYNEVDTEFYSNVDNHTSGTENENETANQEFHNSTENGSTRISELSFKNKQEDTSNSNCPPRNEDDCEFTNYQSSRAKKKKINSSELVSTNGLDETITQSRKKKKKRTKSNESNVLASHSKRNKLDAPPNGLEVADEATVKSCTYNRFDNSTENVSTLISESSFNNDKQKDTNYFNSNYPVWNEGECEFPNYQNSGGKKMSSSELVSTNTSDETSTQTRKKKKKQTKSNEADMASHSKTDKLNVPPNGLGLVDEASTPERSENHSSVLKPHMPSPGGDESNDKAVLECRNCWEVCSTRSKLDSHIRTAHPPKFTCLKCDMSFGNKDDFYKHESEHGQLQCKICNKIYGHPSSLKRHVKIHEKNGDAMPKETSKSLYSCLLCPEKSDDALKARDHLMTHNVGQSYECLTCAKSYERKDALVLHCIQMDHVSSHT